GALVVSGPRSCAGRVVNDRRRVVNDRCRVVSDCGRVVNDPHAGVALWDLHFRDPPRGFELAQARLHEGSAADVRSRAWAKLTVAFHHLFVTARPEAAEGWLERARS